ncbi:MAG: hypothetical protein ACK2TV_14685 [Anaerolineales bacterium]
MEMNTMLVGGTLILVFILLLVVLVILFLQLRKPEEKGSSLDITVQTMSQTLQSTQTQLAVLEEKINTLGPVTQTISSTLTNKLGRFRRD